MKLPSWLIYRNLNTNDLNIKLSTDLFESYIGALDTTANSIQKGLGGLYVYNYIILIFSNIYLDPNLVYGNSKTSLIQRSETLFPRQKFSKGPFISITEKNENNNTVTEISINPEIYDSFKKIFGYSLKPNEIIGVGVGYTKKSSENVAWTKAVEYMEKKYNFTYENCTLKSLMIKLNKHNPELVTICKKKALDLYDCDYLEFEQPKSSHGKNTVTTILYGFNSQIPYNIQEKRKKIILTVYTYTENNSDNTNDKKIEFLSEEGALNEFANS